MPDRHATKPVAVRLPDSERKAIKAAAHAEDIAVNEWLRRAIRERLRRQQETSSSLEGSPAASRQRDGSPNGEADELQGR
jgi:hypothetical protein